MRIIQIITLSEPIGGAQMVLFNNTQAMIKAGHDVCIIVGQEGTLTSRLKALEVEVNCIPSLVREISLLKDYRCIKEIQNFIKSYQPDVVISHSSKAGILSRIACYRNGTRNIFTVHGWSFTPGVRGFKRYVFMAIEKLMGPFTDRVITVSDFDRRQALKYRVLSDNKMRVVYNGSPDLSRGDIREVHSGKLRILMVARFQYPKDHMTLFNSLVSLKTEDIKVDLVGSGEFMSYFVDLAKKMNISHLIEFHGESNEVPFFLNNSDIFVLISKFEALPLSICEAMSVGIPIIASNVGGIHEMIEDDHNGYLIPKEDHNYLTDKIKHFIENKDLLKTMGQNSKRIFEDKFSINTMWASTEKYLNDILLEDK